MNVFREIALVAFILGVVALAFGAKFSPTHEGRACQNAFDEAWESSEFHASVLESGGDTGGFEWRSWVFACTHQTDGSTCRGASEDHGTCDVFLVIGRDGDVTWRP